MKQHINLYVTPKRYDDVEFSVSFMLDKIYMLLGILFLISIVLIWQKNRNDVELEDIQAKIDAAEKQFNDLEGRLAKLKDNSADEAVLEGLRKTIEEKERYAKVVNSYTVGDVKFSGFLRALSEKHIKGIWLTEIDLMDYGNEIKLKGNSAEANLIPVFMHKLEESEIFTRKPVVSFDIGLDASNDTNSFTVKLFKDKE